MINTMTKNNLGISEHGLRMESYEDILECLWENSKKPRQKSVTYFFKHTELFLDYIFMSLPGVEDGRVYLLFVYIPL